MGLGLRAGAPSGSQAMQAGDNAVQGEGRSGGEGSGGVEMHGKDNVRKRNARLLEKRARAVVEAREDSTRRGRGAEGSGEEAMKCMAKCE